MRDIIRKVLKESRNDKFITTFHSMLASANAKEASMFGVHPDDWYLGSQIVYKWSKNSSLSQSVPFHCVFYGSPDVKVAEEMALFNLSDWSYEDSGYKLYCNMINQYYDLDNFEISTDDKSIYAYLDRTYNLVHTQDDIDVKYYIEDPIRWSGIFGYEYNNYDEESDIGTFHRGITNEVQNMFTKNNAEEYVINWTKNKILTDNYREL